MWNRKTWRLPFDNIICFMKSVNKKKKFNKGFNLRLPEEMVKLIDEDVDTLKEKLDLKGNDITRNQLIFLALMSGLNYKQNERGEIVRGYGSLETYLNEYKRKKK